MPSWPTRSSQRWVEPLILGGDDETCGAGRRPSTRSSPAAAATIRTGSSAVSTSSTSSAPSSATQSAPAKPMSRDADVEHLDDVLGLEELGLEAVQRQGRPVAATVEGEADARVLHEREHVLLHPALGQGQMDDGQGRI